MNDNWTITERDAVLRQRAAFFDGAYWAWVNNYAECTGAKFNHEGYVHEQAADRYPLPTITRPRVVKDAADPSVEFCFVDGVLQYRADSGSWWRLVPDDGRVPTTIFYPTAERVRLWADLLANPTEEVTA